MSRVFALAALVASAFNVVNAFGSFKHHEMHCPECETCPALLDKLQMGSPDDALLRMAYSAGDAQNFLNYIKDAKPIGYHQDLIAEASDAIQTNAPVIDGKSGDTAFPHGNLKALVTVGEYFPGNGEFHVGVPDGMGAYLLDDNTVRYIVQSESYGPIRYESFPWQVNDNAASFTGSHIQYLDLDREMLSKFMDHSGPSTPMVKSAGNLVRKAYNLKGEPVGPRKASGPTTIGAHYSNTDAAGNYVVAQGTPTYADWLMQSLCSASMVPKGQWGALEGAVDDLFLTNEEWITIAAGADFVGLSAHALDLHSHELYAVGAFTLGGFEKIVEVKSGSATYVVFSPSGYTGDFGAARPGLTDKRNAAYNRTDGKPYVSSRHISPARLYIGKKGYNAKGQPATDFLSRNGLAYGQNYGFATNVAEETGGLFRDDYHDEAVRPSVKNGDKVHGGFYPISWRWDGEVKNFEHDGSWEFQDHPVNAPAGVQFWSHGGPDKSGAKTEHNTPSPTGKQAFYQGSNAGYIGVYDFPELGALLTALEASPGATFPDMFNATYTVLFGEQDVSGHIKLNGKGMRADGLLQTHMQDDEDKPGQLGKATFEDIDGLEALGSPDGDYLLIQEDGGNAYGERTFLTKVHTDGTPMDFYFIAQSGGELNTRMAAGVGIPAGTTTPDVARGHEFSGIVDLSGLVYKYGASQSWYVKASDKGYKQHEANALVPVNHKTIAVGLQAHNMFKGVIEAFRNDRGGQVYIYRPHLPVTQ